MAAPAKMLPKIKSTKSVLMRLRVPVIVGLLKHIRLNLETER